MHRAILAPVVAMLFATLGSHTALAQNAEASDQPASEPSVNAGHVDFTTRRALLRSHGGLVQTLS